ncbi:hypothetical protein C8J57DRAFT_1303778 [Mycena rebaudengoi]|nr:hypothetical protein C8J57DRAFT_1303778 [Mycena rebaudengoi]
MRVLLFHFIYFIRARFMYHLFHCPDSVWRMPFLRCFSFVSRRFVRFEAFSLFGVLHIPFISRPAPFFPFSCCWYAYFPPRFVSFQLPFVPSSLSASCFPSAVPTLMLIFLPFVSRSVQETAPAHEWVNHPRGWISTVSGYCVCRVRCVTFLLLFLLR